MSSVRLTWTIALAVLAIPLHAASANDKLAADARAVLDRYCGRCHGATRQSGNLDVLNYKSLFAPRDGENPYVKPRDVKKSYLWDRVESGDMPPSTAKQPSDADKAILKKWIEAGAVDFTAKAVARSFISEREKLGAIRDHLDASEEDDRPYLRYFTLTHLHNDSRVTDADLRLARAALAKAVNSLTWKKALVIPEAVDKNATVFAVDLRDLDWDRKPGDHADRWTLLLRRYPYGMRFSESSDDALRKADERLYALAGKKLNYIRADWFVAEATRPPLYHDMLRLPHHAGELEKKLGVDVGENFRRNRLVRAGFNKSGVSGQNRLVERHDALHGAYWKSYDFKKGGDRGNLHDHPLGPDLASAYGGKFPFADAVFHHDGGEIIWHLPNGLQGYLLVDGKDRRIDEGPQEVVSDEQKTSGTSAIVTGLSCIACHKNGMISNFQDTIRRGTTVSGNNRLKVRRLYPPHETIMKKLLKEDEELFMTSLRKVVGPFLMPPGGDAKALDTVLASTKEPIMAVAVKYQADLSLEDVAAELGMEKSDELRVLIKGSEKLRELGLAVLLDKGVIKRPDWDRIAGRSLFQRVSLSLDLGSPWNER